MKSIIILVVSIAAGLSLAATPQVKNVKAFQQYPWGKVCISYEVDGNVAANAGNEGGPFLVIVAKDKATGKILFEADDSCLSGDTGTAPGVHRVVWDIGAQGVTINSANVTFMVMYCDKLYLVVDLSTGANSSYYPVSYFGNVPSGGWTDAYKTTKIVLRRIPAGTFRMQNTSNVTLTKPFYMGVFEVTQKQYMLVMGAAPSGSTGDTLPVGNVSYETIRGTSNGAMWPASSAVDSTSFIGKLRVRTGLNFDLPTEAQWEYACRAGTTTIYYWGNSMNDDYCWHKGNSSYSTHPVGTKMPNAWGLYDMSGNVPEWCLDWWSETLAYGTDPQGPSSGSYRVMRSGSWSSHEAYYASSDRVCHRPEYGTTGGAGFGFRIAGTLSN